MANRNIDSFSSELLASLKAHFSGFRVEILFQTQKSLKANVYLNPWLFIAVRYNARNDRTDVALIQNHQRIFGYDNVKQWHYHPFPDSSRHIPCQKPALDKIMSDIRAVYKRISDNGK